MRQTHCLFTINTSCCFVSGRNVQFGSTVTKHSSDMTWMPWVNSYLKVETKAKEGKINSKSKMELQETKIQTGQCPAQPHVLNQSVPCKTQPVWDGAACLELGMTIVCFSAGLPRWGSAGLSLAVRTQCRSMCWWDGMAWLSWTRMVQKASGTQDGGVHILNRLRITDWQELGVSFSGSCTP